MLTLNRPPANAIDVSLLEAISEAAGAAEADPAVRAVVVTGAGRFFSGGLDLKAMAGGQAQSMGRFGSDDGVFRLWTLPKPTVAMVNGHAIAGGSIVALACDFRVAAAGSYKIGLNETAIGLALPTGAFEIARLALPVRSGRTVLLEAGLHDPATAKGLGLVDEVVEGKDLEPRALALARSLGAAPLPAYAANKAAWQRPAVDRVRNEPREVRDAITRAWTSEETTRAFTARMAATGSRSS